MTADVAAAAAAVAAVAAAVAAAHVSFKPFKSFILFERRNLLLFWIFFRTQILRRRNVFGSGRILMIVWISREAWQHSTLRFSLFDPCLAAFLCCWWWWCWCCCCRWLFGLIFLNMGQPRPLFVYFWSQGIYRQWQYTLTIEWTFPHCSVVFISGFFSQREGVLGRFAPLLVTVHLMMPLMLTTVDMMPVTEASHAAPMLEWVAKLKMKSKMYRIGKARKTEVARVQL